MFQVLVVLHCSFSFLFENVRVDYVLIMKVVDNINGFVKKIVFSRLRTSLLLSMVME